jgi:hypothetical protein
MLQTVSRVLVISFEEDENSIIPQVWRYIIWNYYSAR